MYFTATIAIPKTDNTTPVALFKVFAGALFANLAATLAPIRVNRIHRINAGISGRLPLIEKWDTAPVNAVKDMINTLVPTAVFNSYPNMLVSMRSIIIPPPAPIKPQINPMTMPHRIDCMIFVFLSFSSNFSFVVMTGLTINLIPKSRVIKTENPPIVVFGRRDAM